VVIAVVVVVLVVVAADTPFVARVLAPVARSNLQ